MASDSVALLDHPALDDLTERQRRFALAYAANPNGTTAAREAGYSGDDNALAAAASRLLRNVKVRGAVDSLLSDFVMSKEEALSRLSDEARGDIGDFIEEDEHGHLNLTMRKAQDRGLTRLLKKVKTRTTTTTQDGKTETTQTVEFEMYDAQAAKDKVLKAHGVYGTGSGTTVNVAVQNNVGMSLHDFLPQPDASA